MQASEGKCNHARGSRSYAPINFMQTSASPGPEQRIPSPPPPSNVFLETITQGAFCLSDVFCCERKKKGTRLHLSCMVRNQVYFHPNVNLSPGNCPPLRRGAAFPIKFPTSKRVSHSILHRQSRASRNQRNSRLVLAGFLFFHSTPIVRPVEPAKHLN